LEEIAVRVDDDLDRPHQSAYEIALAHCEESRVEYEKTLAAAPAKAKSAARLLNLLNRQFSSQPYTSKFIYQHQLNIWVYRCVSVIVGAAIRPEPRQYREFLSKGVLKSEALPPDHPAVKILQNPNGYDTWRDLAEKIWTSWELTGMWFLLFDKKLNTLDHLRSDRIEILPDNRKLIGGYRYSVVGQTQDFLPEEVVYGKHWNPDDDYYGLPPLKAASNSIASHMKASAWNLNFFDNSAMLLGYLKSNYDFSNDKALLEQIRSEWSELYQGYSKFGKFAVLGGDLDWKPLSPTHTEMGFVSLLDRARDEIAAAFGVPNIFMNVTEGMNYANSREHQSILWQTKMIPQIKKLEATLDKFLNTHFADKGERIVTRFDLTQIEALREGAVAEAEASRVYTQSGQRTINEARARRGEAPLDGGDVSLVPMSFVRLDQVGDVLAGQTPATGQLSASRARVKRKSLITDPAKRLAHWTETKGIITAGQNRMQRLIVAIVSDWRREMLANLNADKSIKALETKALSALEIIFDLDTATGMLKRLSKPIFEDSTKRGGDRVFATANLPGAFNLHDPNVDAKLRAAEQRFVNRIGDANWNRVKDSLTEGINNGEPIRDLAARIEAEMDRIDSNALTIARTEVLPRYHEGQIEGMRQSGLIEQKEWLSAFADDSREDHMAADGQVVGIDESFLVGGEYLAYPGAPSGSASNIINCLCDVLPVVAGAEE